jgi:hypothetical protein
VCDGWHLFLERHQLTQSLCCACLVRANATQPHSQILNEETIIGAIKGRYVSDNIHVSLTTSLLSRRSDWQWTARACRHHWDSVTVGSLSDRRLCGSVCARRLCVREQVHCMHKHCVFRLFFVRSFDNFSKCLQSTDMGQCSRETVMFSHLLSSALPLADSTNEPAVTARLSHVNSDPIPHPRPLIMRCADVHRRHPCDCQSVHTLPALHTRGKLLPIASPPLSPHPSSQ